MAIVVGAEHAGAAERALARSGETVFRIGRIEQRSAGEPQCDLS
jgi:hypothetical protein